MHTFAYKNGALHCEEVNLADIAATVGTPTFVYSRKTIMDDLAELQQVLAPLNAHIAYAVKACSNKAILNLMAKQGVGFDIVSGGELWRVVNAGGDPTLCTYAGVGKTEAEIRYALSLNIYCFNCESENELREINRIAGEKVVRQVKLQIMEKSLKLDLGSFDDPNLYEKMENANQEAGNRPLQIITQTFSIISSVIEFISYLIILLSAPGLWWATLIIIAVSIPSAIINFIYRRKNFRYMRMRSKERRKMNYYASVLVDKDRIKEVRMFDLGDVFIGRYMKVFAEYYKGLRKLILGENFWHIVISVVSGITNLVFYILIAVQVFTGKIMIGD
jgi:hypothetical protein